MKRISFSILIALFAINAGATTPKKLSAIVIDTLYHASGSFIVEYDIVRPFEQICISVQSSWDLALKDAKPVILTGSVGKGKVSFPINLITEQAMHFNVFISGRHYYQ